MCHITATWSSPTEFGTTRFTPLITTTMPTSGHSQVQLASEHAPSLTPFQAAPPYYHYLDPEARVWLVARTGDDVWILTIDRAHAEGSLQEAYELEQAMPCAPTDLTRLGSLYPDLALERLRLHELVVRVPSTLTPLERRLAAFVTSTLNGATRIASGLRSGLVRLGAPDWLLDNIRTESVQWGVSDDDRIDVIVAYAAQLTRAPAGIDAGNINCLRSVGLTDLDILDLNNVVAYYNYIDRVANGLGPRSAVAADDDRCPQSGNGEQE